MLSNTISKYLRLFKESPSIHLSLKLNDEMRKEFQDLPPSVNEVIHELEKFASNPSYPGASFIMTAAWNNLSKDYTLLLCQILNDDRTNSLHEPVVEILGELSDERAIYALSKALTYRWSYDEWLNVPRKSLQALAVIGTPEAMREIKEATYSSEDLIREDAKMILENI